MKTIMTLAASALIAATATAQAETYQLKALGQPVATGLIQKNVEQPFFENFAEKTGIDATVDYKPLDVTGIKDTEQLRILKAGLFDIVSLRMSQVSRDEPTILGLDLVGLNPDYDTGRGGLPGQGRRATASQVQHQTAGRLALRPAGAVL